MISKYKHYCLVVMLNHRIAQNFNGENFYGFGDLLTICQLMVEML